MEEFVKFNLPRPHAFAIGKWLVIGSSDNRYSLFDDGSVGLSKDYSLTPSRLFNSEDDALKALTAYKSKFIGEKEIPSELIPLIGVFELRLPVYNGITQQYYMPATTGKYLWNDLKIYNFCSRKNGYFKTYQQALFAKLRYERKHSNAKLH